MTDALKLAAGREFVKRVEADLGYALDSHIIDLFMDNADKLNFTDEDCLAVGNVVYADKGIAPTKKWW